MIRKNFRVTVGDMFLCFFQKNDLGKTYRELLEML